jgi:hypothetical protein
MDLLFIPEKHHFSILDGDADSCVIAKGWNVLSTHNSRRADVVRFGHTAAIKRNISIARMKAALHLPNCQSISLLVDEGTNHQFIVIRVSTK